MTWCENTALPAWPSTRHATSCAMDTPTTVTNSPAYRSCVLVSCSTTMAVNGDTAAHPRTPPDREKPPDSISSSAGKTATAKRCACTSKRNGRTRRWNRSYATTPYTITLYMSGTTIIAGSLPPYSTICSVVHPSDAAEHTSTDAWSKNASPSTVLAALPLPPLRCRPTRVGFDIAAGDARVPPSNARTQVRCPRSRGEVPADSQIQLSRRTSGYRDSMTFPLD